MYICKLKEDINSQNEIVDLISNFKSLTELNTQLSTYYVDKLIEDGKILNDHVLTKSVINDLKNSPYFYIESTEEHLKIKIREIIRESLTYQEDDIAKELILVLNNI